MRPFFVSGTRFCLVAVVLWIASCAPSQAVRVRAPDTAADPLPYVPPPTNRAAAGNVSGLVAVDNGNVAIDVVRGFFEAAAVGTVEEIEEYLLEPVMVNSRRGRRPMRARQISVGFLSQRRRTSFQADTLVDLNALEFGTTAEGPGLEPNDQAVVVPIIGQGTAVLNAVLGWTGAHGVVYVRPRARRIVAFQ